MLGHSKNCIFVFLPIVAPVSVAIVNKGDQLVVGESEEVVCRSSGSRPPAHTTWFLDGNRIGGGAESVSSKTKCYHICYHKYI